MLMSRKELHQLIDELPEEMLFTAASFLESLLEYDSDMEELEVEY